MIQKHVRLNPVSLYDTLRITRSTKVSHFFKPRIQRQSMFETRSTLPEEILLASQVNAMVLGCQPIGRQNRHRAVSISLLVRELEPT